MRRQNTGLEPHYQRTGFEPGFLLGGVPYPHGRSSRHVLGRLRLTSFLHMFASQGGLLPLALEDSGPKRRWEGWSKKLGEEKKEVDEERGAGDGLQSVVAS